MRLTLQTDYSLRVLIYLATAERRVAVREIASQFDISKNHLMKIVQPLVRAGYITSARGQGGGLTLREAPANIVIGDVVRTMEPDFFLVDCQVNPDNCVISPACQLKLLIERSRDAFLAEMNGTTLQQLLPTRVKTQLLDLLEIA